MFAMLFSLTFLLPVFMQEVLGFTATQSGLALMPRTLIMMLVTPIVGKLYNKISPRLVVGFGVILFVISAFQMSHYTLETSSAGIVSALLIQGVAFACLFVPLTTVALSTIPRNKIADATGSNSLVRQIGGSVGVAIFATLQTRAVVAARHGLVAHLYPGRPEVIQRLASTQADVRRARRPRRDDRAVGRERDARLHGDPAGDRPVLREDVPDSQASSSCSSFRCCSS